MHPFFAFLSSLFSLVFVVGINWMPEEGLVVAVVAVVVHYADGLNQHPT